MKQVKQRTLQKFLSLKLNKHTA